MTSTPPVAVGQFGQTLAFAERTLTAGLRRQLAERGSTPATWYALKLIAAGQPLDRAVLSRDLEGSRSMNEDTTRQLLARLQAQGLIRGDLNVQLTVSGETLYRSLAEHIAGPASQLLGQFDPEDIATTIRTLQAITLAAADPATHNESEQA